MLRKLVAAVLLLVPFSSGPAVANAMSSAMHLCGCDEKMCRCPQHSPRQSRPKCHEPDGASITNCSSEEGPLLATTPFLLPQPTTSQALKLETLVAGVTVHPLTHSEDINPPPPRRLL